MPLAQYGQVGPQLGLEGSQLPTRVGRLGDAIASELHPRYYEMAYRNQVFGTSVVTAAAITAFTGGAAGTPQIAVWNPSGSGKNVIIISASVANVVAASAAGTVAWGIYFGPTAAITQATVTAPTNMASQVAAGSVATAFKNVALTSGTAAANVIALGSYYWATAAGAAQVAGWGEADIGGKLVIPPGSYAALGGSSALTSATWIGTMIWAESPV